ncbi:hypothetical protein E2C01_058281 [Portunus trituberculatus]|uniref:Uncharacterized protein n=1 Tax=Portunus trituberculatus TaxID=210409 RepID=A0A5B7GW11_PORTR|nr:hypothetical protein [Portunus trituberculatus]
MYNLEKKKGTQAVQGVVGCTHNSKGGVTLVLFHQLSLSRLSTVNKHGCPFTPSQLLLFFRCYFWPLMLFMRNFKQLCPLENDGAAHLGHLLLGSSALERFTGKCKQTTEPLFSARLEKK